ncbi:DUF805 domain-containing protein [Roseibium sp. RKSG952]|uniref:DUF805 domain-containing protein n=1 Tax=Roseibium sp. RKSG952 TaxID=2529384 RepID=UPI0012BC11B6|nr:DUF805 domain-containing protein [Roseibium sp. RKSG952]MTH97062.1 DUF805 domain-containing protein [Roseibium sp. RKSG952]
MAPNPPAANLTPSVFWALLSPIGRISREAYWLGFALIWIVIGIAMRMWWSTMDPNVPIDQLNLMDFVGSNPLFPFLFFALQWIELALVIKRSQDAGLTGFLGLLVLVPFINLLAVIIIGLLPAQPAPNRYGPVSNSYYRRRT